MKRFFIIAILLLCTFSLAGCGTPDHYIGHNKTHKFHKPDCQYGSKITDAHKVIFKTREEAINSHYKPCTVCNP